MNIIMNYMVTKALYEKLGPDEFFKLFDETFNFDFFTMSQDWLNSKEYILKFKGGSGDLIVQWD